MTGHLVFIAVPLALLALFLAFVAYEERAGRRMVLAGRRHVFDLKMERAFFIIDHVNWGALFQDMTRSGFERMLHDVAHTTLMFVRALERELTSVVRTLRARREPMALPSPDEGEPSRIAAAAAYIRKSVRRSRKLPVRDEEAA